MGLDMGSIKQRYLTFAVISSVNMFRKSSSLVKVLGKNVMKAIGLDIRAIKQRKLTFAVISSVNVFRKSSSLVKMLGKNVMKAMGLDMQGPSSSDY
jgi:hypothetical protein